MIRLPLTHRRTPSSDLVEKVMLPVVFGRIQPVQRTEKLLAPMPAAGEPLPQAKLIAGSVRASLR